MEQPSMLVSNGGNIARRRHPAARISRLEEIFQTLKHPNHKQKLEIAEELDVDPKQVTHWFSHKRRKVKVAREKAHIDALQEENERILEENIKMKKALDNELCESCMNPQILNELQMENKRLKQKIEEMSKLPPRYVKTEELSLELKLGPPTSS